MKKKATRMNWGTVLFLMVGLWPWVLFGYGPSAQAAFPSPAPQGEGSSNVAGRSSNASFQAIPFQLGCGFLVVVEGRIGPLTGLRFVLDTGTTHSLVDARIADRLSLLRQDGQVLNFDRSVRISWTTIPDLQLGPLVARDMRVMTGALSQLSEFATQVDGVIGLDFLRLSRGVHIDFETNQVAFKTGAEGQPSKTGPAKALTAQLEMNGQPVRLVVDTGASQVFLFEDRLRRHLEGYDLHDGAMRASAGPIRGRLTSFLKIRMGTSELDAPVFLLERAPDSLPNDIDGYLGAGAMNVRFLEIDFEKNVLWYVESDKKKPIVADAETLQSGREPIAARLALVSLP